MRRDCTDCPGKVEGHRKGARCLACSQVYQEKRRQENVVARLCSGLNLRALRSRHKGKQ